MMPLFRKPGGMLPRECFLLSCLKEEFKPGRVLLDSILEALLFSSVCLRPAVLISKGP